MVPCDVLVVDDDTEGRNALALVLEAHGCTVRQAENGRIALSMIAERVPCIMLLDLEMPVMSGWEVLASLQNGLAFDAMSVVVLSASSPAPLGVAFIRKPCEVENLFGFIRASRHPQGADGPP